MNHLKGSETMERSYGVYMPGSKEMTSKNEIKIAKVPDKVYIPLSQHLGAPAKPIVEIGDKVKMGQKIGEADGFISAPVHSSVSGTVIAFERMAHSNLGYADHIVIENDHLDEKDTALQELFPGKPEQLEPNDLIKIVAEAGIVGLGGATFPTHVKYMSAGKSRVEYVILNGGECEPYLTSDHRRMVENAGLIIKGLQYIMKMVNCDKGIIGIEDNKPDAIKLLKHETADIDNIEIKEFPAVYPGGSEKQLIHTCIGKEVPSGKLPLEVGVIVNNVRTAIAITEAVEFKIPLIERVVTITGTGVKEPANYLVRMGVLLSDVIEESGGYTGEVGKLIVGGPMMGRTLFTDQVPINKGSSGALVLLKDDLVEYKERTCVRCAKCVDTCPMYLEPTTIVQRVKAGEIDDALDVGLMDCIECGLCAYGCPSRIPLTQYIKEGKAVFRSRPKPKE